MVNFLKNRKRKKSVIHAENLVRSCNKVINFRKDVLAQKDIQVIQEAKNAVTNCLKDKDAVSLEVLEDHKLKLHMVLKRYGGKIYPVDAITDNVEMIVVAAILAIAIRSFFFQPFKIPTNSMYPTYAGMLPAVYTKENPRTGFSKIKNFLLQGASSYKVPSPDSGRLTIPLFSPGQYGGGDGWVRYEVVYAPKWFGLMKEQARKYTFYVNGKPASVIIPLEFSLDNVILKRYFPGQETFEGLVRKEISTGSILPDTKGLSFVTDITIDQSDNILDFDILSGDMLFVDRFTYNFRSPKVGEPIVFKTINIPGKIRYDGSVEDKYYIKRLVGLGGDTLEIKDYTLFSNGNPIEGADAFDKNAKRVGLYPGYRNVGYLAKGMVDVVPAESFYAMGDNSPHSGDSRYWGHVPIKEAVGKALFIFYPFTYRWGVAK